MALPLPEMDLSGTTLRGSCIVLAQFCGSFTTPSPPNFLGLIISDTATPGGELDPIINVTSSLLSSSQIFFDANTIVIDISGLALAVYPAYTNLIEVEFGTATATVPVPAALPLFASGLGLIGLIAGRRKRKTGAKA